MNPLNPSEYLNDPIWNSCGFYLEITGHTPASLAQSIFKGDDWVSLGSVNIDRLIVLCEI